MEAVGKVTIKEIVASLQYKQITGDEEALKRWVIVPDVNRPGLELTGFYKFSEPRRIVIIGEKEAAYISTLEEGAVLERFDKLTDSYTPCIIFAHRQKCPAKIAEIASSKNFPILETNEPTYQVMVELVTFLDAKMAPVETFHGVLINVYGKGVLIMGESGMGKSELALELIRKGHILIADDRVDISRIHNELIGRAPELLEGMLEIRGIGIIDVARMFGGSSLLREGRIDYVISLDKFETCKEYLRVGNEEQQYKEILGIDVPVIVLPVKEGRNMSVLVESAVTNFQLKERGYNSAKLFEQKVFNHIEDKNRQAEEIKKEG